MSACSCGGVGGLGNRIRVETIECVNGLRGWDERDYG